MPWQKEEVDYNRAGTRKTDLVLSGAENSYQLEKQLGLRGENGRKLIQKLKPKHHRCVELHLAGVATKEIALALGVTEDTIWGWLRDPLVQEKVQQGRQMFEGEFDALYGRAIDAVRSGLGDVDPTHRLRAAAIYFKQKQEAAALKVGGGKETAEDVIARMLQVNIQINQQETK